MRKKYIEIGLIVAILLIVAALILNFTKQDFKYQQYDTGSVHYVKAQTVKILEQELTLSESNGEYLTGYQKIQVRMLEGDRKGDILEVDNYVTVQHHVIAQPGKDLIICADEPENVEPYYSVYNYSRESGIWILVIVFLALVVLVGRKQGLMSCVGLLFTMCMIFCYLLPQLYNGKDGLAASIVTVILACAVSSFRISGLTQKTLFNMVSAIAGGLLVGFLFKICAVCLNLNGCSMDEAESLILITQATGLKLESVLYSGVMVSSLGAVMDIAVSIGASLQEIISLKPEIKQKELFRSGMNIGRDAIGTMTNTLILAFAGGTLATLLILISYGVQFNQLISSNFLDIEIAQGLAGSAAIILTVPISAFVNAVGRSLLHR